MKLISLATLKGYLGISDNTEDATLTTLIEQVSSQFQTYLDRKLELIERTQYFESGAVLVLSEHPVNLIAAFTLTIYDSALTINNDYYVDADKGIITLLIAQITSYPRKIKVIYTAGYDATNGVLNVPDDIKYACTKQCAQELARKKTGGVSQLSLESGSVTYEQSSGFLKDIKEILDRYRRVGH